MEKLPYLFTTFVVLHSLRFFNSFFYISLLGPYNLVILDILLGILFTCYYLSSLGLYSENVIKTTTDCLYFLFLLSIVTGTVIGNQSMFYSFYGAASWGYLNLGLFYYLLKQRVSFDFIHQLLLYLIASYVCVMILSYLLYPTILFGYNALKDNMDQVMQGSMQDRGVLRLMIPGDILAALGIFYVIERRDSIKWAMCYIALLYAVVLMTGSRGPMIWTLVGTVLVYFSTSNRDIVSIVKLSALGLVLSLILYLIPFTNNIIVRTLQFSQTQYETHGTEIDRFFALHYFLFDFNRGQVLPTVFGNGVAKSGGFADRLTALHDVGFWETDTEYSQTFLFFGCIGICVFLYWTYVLISHYQRTCYIRYFFIYMLLCMTLGRAFQPNIAIIVLILYQSYLLSQDETQCNYSKL